MQLSHTPIRLNLSFQLYIRQQHLCEQRTAFNCYLLTTILITSLLCEEGTMWGCLCGSLTDHWAKTIDEIYSITGSVPD